MSHARHELALTLEDVKGGRTPLRFVVNRMVNAGFVGRDQAAVKAHIDELAAEGIAPPPMVPMLFPVLRSALAVTDGADDKVSAIEVTGDRTSGEAECVLLLDGGRVYVGVGSDHTDRALEAADMLASKQVCANVMGATVWDYADLADHWDELVIESWTVGDEGGAEGGGEQLYQQGALGMLLSADEVLKLVRSRMPDGCTDGLVIFCGTVPIIGGRTIYGRRFRCALRDAKLKRQIGCAYDVRLLNYLTMTANA
jgi:hypothetical protein